MLIPFFKYLKIIVTNLEIPGTIFFLSFFEISEISKTSLFILVTIHKTLLYKSISTKQDI